MDRLTSAQRRKNMQAVKSKDSAIEIILRKELWRRGLRYRKNVKGITGHPDIVFTKAKVAIFCDGEFWHGYNWEKRKEDFKSNRDFWIPKIERNMERDKEVTEMLQSDGWIVLRYWGKEIQKKTKEIADEIETVLESRKVY